MQQKKMHHTPIQALARERNHMRSENEASRKHALVSRFGKDAIGHGYRTLIPAKRMQRRVERHA
jgi:hypothetical protein